MRLDPILRKLRHDPIHEPKRAGGRRLHPRQAPSSLESGGRPYQKGAHLKRLLSFDDVRRELVANNRLHRGTRVVEADEIVGSVGRWDEFDRSFLPARASVGHKWKRIDRAFHRTEDLPPVKLFKLEEAYFVVDGHHRVSVARYHDVPTLEAAVVEFLPRRPAAPVPTLSNNQFRI